MDQIGGVGIVALVAIAIAVWIGLLVWLWRDERKDRDHVGTNRDVGGRDPAAEIELILRA
jgi:hypothetical protein